MKRYLGILLILTSCAGSELEQCRSDVRKGKFLSDEQCMGYRSIYRNQNHLVKSDETREMLEAIDRSPASYYMEQERNIICGIKPLVPRKCRLHCIEGVWQKDCPED